MELSRVVRPRGAPVSWLVMHLQVKLSAMIAVVFAVCVCAGARVGAQASNSQPGSQQPGSQPQPSSSSQSSSSTQGHGQSQEPTPAYGVYLSVDPLAKVRYDNR